MTTTMKRTKPITKAEVRQEIRKIKAEMPDNVNPMRLGSFGHKMCLYHQGRGANIKRCLIGQLAWNLGLPTPIPEAGGAADVADYGVWKGLFTEAAKNYLADLQDQADGSCGSDPIPWGQVRL